MILAFKTKVEAQEVLAKVNQAFISELKTKGYKVSNGEIIGKNAKTNADEPSKTRTTCWDVIKQSPVGTFYFAKPDDDIVGVLGLQDRVKEIPISWFGEGEGA